MKDHWGNSDVTPSELQAAYYNAERGREGRQKIQIFHWLKRKRNFLIWDIKSDSCSHVSTPDCTNEAPNKQQNILETRFEFSFLIAAVIFTSCFNVNVQQAFPSFCCISIQIKIKMQCFLCTVSSSNNKKRRVHSFSTPVARVDQIWPVSFSSVISRQTWIRR